MTYEFDVTSAADPLGTVLTTLGDDELRADSAFRVTENGPGRVELVIGADNPKAALIPDEPFVRIRDTVLGTYIHSGVPNGATVKLISRKADRRELRRFGPGGLGFLRHGSFRTTNYSTNPVATPDIFTREPGSVVWYLQPWIAILTRAIEEGQDMPGNPLGVVTTTFDRSADSAGIAPTLIDEEGFRIPWGQNIYELAEAFMGFGVILDMSPGLVLSAWETNPGTDHSGSAFASDVVRFQVGSSATDVLANLMTETERVWTAERTSHLLVIGSDGVTAVVVSDSGAPVKKTLTWHYPESSDPAILTAVGQAELARRALRAIGSLRVPVPLANDPTHGKYLPGPGRPCWVRNTASIFTGSETYDISADMKIAALDWKLTNEFGWTCHAEMGSIFIDRAGLAESKAIHQIVRGTTPRPHSHPENLCRHWSGRLSLTYASGNGNDLSFGYFDANGDEVELWRQSTDGGPYPVSIEVGGLGKEPTWYMRDHSCGGIWTQNDYGPINPSGAFGPHADHYRRVDNGDGTFNIEWNDGGDPILGGCDTTDFSFTDLVVVLSGVVAGDLHPDLAQDGGATPGTSVRRRRCDGRNEHGYIVWRSAISTDPHHDARGIAIDPSYLEADDVDAAFEELPDVFAPKVHGHGAAAGAYAQLVGDGSATSFDIVHGLNTLAAIVELWDLSGATPERVEADVSLVDTDTVRVVTAPTVVAAGELRVVVHGAEDPGEVDVEFAWSGGLA